MAEIKAVEVHGYADALVGPKGLSLVVVSDLERVNRVDVRDLRQNMRSIVAVTNGYMLSGVASKIGVITHIQKPTNAMAVVV